MNPTSQGNRFSPTTSPCHTGIGSRSHGTPGTLAGHGVDGTLVVRDDDGALVGFYLFAVRDDALFYGLGMRPDLTGRGLGEQFVLAGLEFSRRSYGRRRIVLDVAAFNERAIRLYRRLGFTETGRHTKTFSGYGAVEFIDMVKPA